MQMSASIIMPVMSSLSVSMMIDAAMPSARKRAIVNVQYLIVLKAFTDDAENALCWLMLIKRRYNAM